MSQQAMSTAAEIRTIASRAQPFSLAMRCEVSAKIFWYRRSGASGSAPITKSAMPLRNALIAASIGV
ncbi:hypothetical protein D3C83_64380 [compost metagenome]